MTKKCRIVLIILILGAYAIPQNGLAQIENNPVQDTLKTDDLEDISDKFQTYFFEALTQKAIKNYEKAIKALKNCAELDSDKAVVFFELGDNYAALGNYSAAETYYKKALALAPDNRAILEAIFKVYYHQENLPKAIQIAQKLVKSDSDYEGDLTQLYLLNQEYVTALKALDRWSAKRGENQQRRMLKRKIIREGNSREEVGAYLKKAVQKQPENIRHYTDLIYFYELSGETQKAFHIAEELQEIDPNTPQAHLALYPVYIKQGKYDQGVQSMQRVLESAVIDNDLKKKVVQDFSAFVKKHPDYENNLVHTLGEESSRGHQSNQQMGEYYLGKNNKKALRFFEKALGETPRDFTLIRETLVLRVKEKQYGQALKLSKRALEIYPAQPVLYWLRGAAENGSGSYKSAEEQLLIGIDFVMDNPKLKLKFYKELAKAYAGLGDSEKSANFQKKAESLKRKIEP